MRVAWRTVGAIAGRVVADARAARDPFDGLRRIGIDEISYRRGHKYLMVVVDHDTGRLVWAAAGHDRATLQTFFDLLGPERASHIRLVSADAAEWIGECALADGAQRNSPGVLIEVSHLGGVVSVGQSGVGVCGCWWCVLRSVAMRWRGWCR